MGADSAKRIAKSLIEDNKDSPEFEVKFWEDSETEQICNALRELGCGVEKSGTVLKVTPPQFKPA